MYANPIYGVLRTLIFFLAGRVEFDPTANGKQITMADGKSFRIFRRVRMKRFSGGDRSPEALFIVRFTPTMSIESNIRLSRIMLFIFMGFKGFRSKFWCVDEATGMCQGLYEWDTKEDAVRYSKSIAVTNMTKRSQPGSISFEVLDNVPENRTWKIEDPGELQRREFILKYDLS